MNSRLPKLDPAELDDAQRVLYEEIVGGRRAAGGRPFPLTDDRGGLEGPFNGFLLQPVVGDRLQALGGAVRFETGLTDRCREIAILTVAVHWESDFEWYAHEAVGRSVGLDDDDLAAIRSGDTTHWADPVERSVATAALDLVGRGDLDDQTYDDVIAALGRSRLFELLVVVGYYSMLALQLRVFRVPLPASAAGP